MSRRLMSMLVVLVLVTAGCGNGNSQSGEQNGKGGASTSPEAQGSSAPAASYGDTGGIKLPIVDKPVTITWMLPSENQDLNNKLFVKEVEKRTGIHLDIQAYPHSSYNDKLKVMLASGKLPDIFHGLPLPEVNKLGIQGALEPITKHLDELPNFKKLYVNDPKNKWVLKSWSDDSNNLYTWPIYGLNRDVNHGFLYRKDVFDKLGIKEWTNTDEFYQALKALKQAYPNSYPYASKTKDLIYSDWAYGWGVGSPTFPAYYDEASKTWKDAYTQPEYKNMLDFMKKLYSEGLLDPEYVTDTMESWTAKMTSNDKAFVTFDWIGRLDLFHNQISSQIPDYNLRYANPVGPTGTIRQLPKIDNFGIVVSSGKNSDIALKLLDYLTSPSGAELVTLGVEGVNYKMENGKPVYPELANIPKVDINVLMDKYGMWQEGMYLRPDHRSVYFNYTEKEKEAQNKMVGKIQPLDPVLKFTDAETKTTAELLPSLDKAGKEFSTKYIMTKSYGDAEWQDWLKNADKLGSGKFIDIYNAVQKRFDQAQ